MDDGSKDESVQIVEKLAKTCSKIIHITQPNGGISKARNAGIAASDSEFIAFLDGDDTWLEDKLEQQIMIIAQGKCDFTYTGFETFSEKITHIARVIPRKFSGQGKHIIKDLYLHGGPILPSSVVLRRVLNGNILYFDEQLKRAEDVDFWLRYLQDARIELCPQILIRRRIHNKSLSSDIRTHFASQIELISKINQKIPWLKSYEKGRLVAIHKKYIRRQIKDAKYFSAFLSVFDLVWIIFRNFRMK